MALLVASSVFATLLLAIIVFGYLKYVKPSQVLDQLRFEVLPRLSVAQVAKKRDAWWMGTVMSVGKMLPLSPVDARIARRELEAAGYRQDSALVVYSGLRLISGAFLFLLMLAVREHVPAAPIVRIALLAAGAAGGYFAPGLVLERLISKRREGIRFALPDALDLLVICTEAGCALDQSLVTVSRELEIAHPALCEELNILNLEVLAGNTRPDALRNFAERTGENEVRKLVAVLIQTDRFGTSVADALRAQSEFMRVRRRQQAEERAGKIGVKLVFPIFFFCLPSLFIIAAGPGMLQLFRTLPALRNVH